MPQPISLQAQELERFNTNASEQMLQQDKLAHFLESLNCQPMKVISGDLGEERLAGYKVRCPVCRTSACFVGLNGKVHKVYWHCYSKACPSQTMKPRNLLSLVRRLRDDDSLKEAIFTISRYLGYKRSYDITNGLSADEQSIPF